MDKKQLWIGSDKLRGAMPMSGYIFIFAGIALVQFQDETKIQNLLQSGNFTVDKFSEAVTEAAHNLNTEIPNFQIELDKNLNIMGVNALQNFLFYVLDVFKTTTPQDFLESFVKAIDINLGRKGGSHTTPEYINELGLNILDISKDETFLDPSCGYGNAILSILNRNPNRKIFGQDINPWVSEVAKIRALLAGATQAVIKAGDVLTNPQYVEKGTLTKFDVVYSDAPMGLRNLDSDIYEKDPYNRFMYGIPPKSSADWAFISNGISSLNDNGRAVFISNSGVLFRGGKEKQIRERIIELDLIEAVISLAPGLLYSTVIPIVMLVINKNKKALHKNKILMINAEDIVSGKKTNSLNKGDIAEIIDLFNNDSEVPGQSKLVDKEDIQDGNLLVARYVVKDNFFEDRELGQVVLDMDKLMEFPTVELKDIAIVNRGFNLTSKNETKYGKYGVIKISDVDNGEIDYKTLVRCDVTKNTKVENYLIEKGDLLISIRGENIKTAVIKTQPENVLFSQNFVSVKVDESIDVEWLKFYMDSPVGQSQLKSQMTSLTVPTLSISTVKSLKIPVIHKDNQTEIIQRYNEKKEQTEKEIERLKKQLANLKVQAFNEMGLEGTFEIKDN